MIYYLKLQFKILNRQILEFGISPIIAYVFITVSFLGISFYLFNTTEYAEYIYALVAFILVIKLSDINRNEFLKSCFLNKKYIKIRLIENTITVILFFLILVYQNKTLTAVIILFFSSLLSFLNTNTSVMSSLF